MDSTLGIVLILTAGIVVVVGGVLVLRLHAFLALVLGALIVGLLTPQSAIERYQADADGYRISKVSESGEQIEFTLSSKKPAVEAGMLCRVVRPSERGPITPVANVEIRSVVEEQKPDGSKKKVARGELQLIAPPPNAPPNFDRAKGVPLRTGDVVLTPDAMKSVNGLASSSAIERIASGFGSTCASIGILIAMASIIGKCLLDSGGADRVVRSTLRLTGEKGAPVAFLTSGFALGIPVFFDTVFYLMIPLGKALRMRTGRNYLLYVLTIVGGATMAHSLVPPTPGPLFVAQQLGVDLGVMILGGCAVGVFTSAYALLHASIVNRRCELPLRESADFKLDELEAIAQRDESDLPPLWLALLPILLPVILIGGETILKNVLTPDRTIALGSMLGEYLVAKGLSVVKFVGDKNIALIISAAIAMLTLIRQKKSTREELAASVQSALAGAGTIILITAAGGAFGAVLKQTYVAGLIRELPTGSPIVLIAAAFLITTAIRTAQGSATVAMITAVGMLSGLATSGELGFHPVYLALAIGCGSKPIAWMNDSGFWVITRMSGMTEGEGLKYVTPMTTIMGLVGLLVVMLAALVMPMA